MRLKDKVAVVTGAAQGIGLAIAERFAREGAKVALGDINAEKGEAAAAKLGAGALFHQADVGYRDQAEGLIARAVAAFGRLDILVNNAGITHNADFLDLDRGGLRPRAAHEPQIGVPVRPGGGAADGGAGRRRHHHQHGLGECASRDPESGALWRPRRARSTS